MFGYINTGRVNIRVCRDITGKMWFGVGVDIKKQAYTLAKCTNLLVYVNWEAYNNCRMKKTIYLYF